LLRIGSTVPCRGGKREEDRRTEGSKEGKRRKGWKKEGKKEKE
jgi:hypothetical protein